MRCSAVLALVIIVAYTFPKWVNTENGRYKFDAFKLNLPFFGNLFRMISTSRFSRTLATLLKGGLPLAEALPIAQNVLQNVVLEEVVDKANQNIISGKAFAEPLLTSGQFPPLLVRMIAVGERTGEMEQMLLEASETYDQRVDSKISALTSLLEPIFIVVLGGFVGLVALAILLPMLNISSIIK